MREHFKDRIPNPLEYRNFQITRIDFVHLSDQFNPRKHNPREALIIARLQVFRTAGIDIRLIADLQDQLDDVFGQKIAVGGGLDDGCCAIRVELIRRAEGFAIIDYALTTSY